MQFNPLKWFETKSASSNLTLCDLFGSSPTLSGMSVGPNTALHVPAVNAAVRVIAESVASLPVNVLKDDGTTKTVDKSHPLYRLIHYEPNAFTSSYDFRLQMQVDCLLHGNAFAFVNRVGGTVREILRLQPTSVSVKVDPDSGEPSYEIRDGSGGVRTCSYVDIIHVKALSTDGTLGVAPIVHCREAIALALALEGHAAKLMGNSARPSGVLKFKGAKLTEAQLARIKAQWQASHNAGSAGGTAVFDSETDFQPLTFNSVDMEFSAMRTFQLDEISRAFRVPPHMLSSLGRATWSNTAEMGQSFLDYTLTPWLLHWQGALSRALLTLEERATYRIDFDASALVRANLTARTESYSRAVQGPFLTPNEVRAIENRPPIDGGDTLNAPQGSAPTAANDNATKEAIAA